MHTSSRGSVLDCGCPSAALALAVSLHDALPIYLRAGTSERKAPEGQAQSKTSRTFGRFTESLDVFLKSGGAKNTTSGTIGSGRGCPSAALSLGARDVQSLRLDPRAGTAERKAPE